MGRSSGTGNPIWFRCPVFRAMDWRTRTGADLARHVITLTGRTKRRPNPNKGNPRKPDVSREYRCSCGHVGWSCHKDLERLENNVIQSTSNSPEAP